MNNPVVFTLNTHGVIVLFLALLVYEFFVLKEQEVALHIIFSVVATLVLTVILKELYTTPRPFAFEMKAKEAGLVLFSGFPSTHTAVSFAIATTVTLHQKKLGVLVFTMASLIGVGRVLANVHYPVDIAFGILVGVVTGIFFDSIHFRRLRERG